MGQRTALGRTKVFPRSGSARATTTSLFNAQGASFDDLTLETLLSGIRLFSSDHIDKAKATRFLGMGIGHDGAVVDIAVLLEKTGDIGLGQTRMDTGDEEVGTGVDRAFIVV